MFVYNDPILSITKAGQGGNPAVIPQDLGNTCYT